MSANDSGGAAPADHVVLVLSPVLIMALVGSLIFFLLEVLYVGDHLGRMRWILFFFVFAAVLIARIALMPEIAGRAHVYAGVLGILVWLAVQQYVEYPPHLARQAPFINLGLIVLAWWCAHRLTWDCTWLDDSVGSSGAGVLEASGLETAPPAQPSTSLERYQQKQKADEGKRRTPGTWVVYFSLAALPLFGLGQALIPVEDEERRRWAFWLMVVYVGSGLGLLLTTSFLGLRFYLQKRRLRMPAAMTASWLGLGALLVVALLALGALLPRPNAEVSLLDLDPAQSKKREASRKNNRQVQPGEDEGDPDGARRGEKDDRQSGKDQAPKDGRDRQPGKDKKDRGGKGGRDANSRQRSEQASNRSDSWLQKLLPILQWIILGVIGLFVLFVLLRALLRSAAGFSNWARQMLEFFQRLWDALLALFRKRASADQENKEEREQERLARMLFASFSNPFEDGRAGGMSPAELARYTFAALESWTRERNLGRNPGETALEFTERVGNEVLPLDRDLQRLGQLYSVIVYGRGGMPANTREVLQRFWDALARVTMRPLSA